MMPPARLYSSPPQTSQTKRVYLYLLSGGVLAAWDLFAPAMMEELRRGSYVYRGSQTRIEKAVLGNEAGLFGAACLPFRAGTAC